MTMVCMIASIVLTAMSVFLLSQKAFEVRQNKKRNHELLARMNALSNSFEGCELEAGNNLHKNQGVTSNFQGASTNFAKENLNINSIEGSFKRFCKHLLSLPLISKLRLLSAKSDAKRDSVERQLPDLIDVVSLGMRSGLSFESSFSMYARRFDTELARSCQSAALTMSSGVESKENALRDLAKSLNSELFMRFSKTVSRSLKYGAHMTPLLERLSEEVRSEYKAKREEAVAKAPTKMLLPTGLLILPAMLILVAGPFLVEFIGQI